MPPKKKVEPPKGKKGGAVGNFDYTDVPTLPHIWVFTVSFLYSFYS